MTNYLLVRMFFYAHSHSLPLLGKVTAKITEVEDAFASNKDLSYFTENLPPNHEFVECIVGISHMLTACKFELDKDQKLDKLYNELNKALPDLRDLRNILVHWDSYLRVEGVLQDDRNGRVPRVPKSNNIMSAIWEGRIFWLGWPDTEEPKASFEVDMCKLYEKAVPLFTYFDEYLKEKIKES